MLVKNAIISTLRPSRDNWYSLSRYFPKGTQYFYGYPSGDNSGFLNNVPPHVEELVSARPFSCAGKNVLVVAFSNPVLFGYSCGFLNDNVTKVVKLPDNIDVNLSGDTRNAEVKQSLKNLVKPGSLVMAQPFLDRDVDFLYQISPKLINSLNDKKNLSRYIPKDLLVRRYAEYANGKTFSKSRRKFPLPCVVKVSSSSAGDGVYICYDIMSYHKVKKSLNSTKGAIIIEQFIKENANYGVQFGVPEDPNQSIEIIGINQQLTTSEGEFIGGIINPNNTYDELSFVKEIIVSEILPQVRDLGWYGVGCFDVLSDDDGFYIIDCNFRMTGMTAYHMLVANRQIIKPLVSFSGELDGSCAEAINIIRSLDDSTAGPLVHILTITENDGVCRFNGAMLLQDLRDISFVAQKVLDIGITSKALSELVV